MKHFEITEAEKQELYELFEIGRIPEEQWDVLIQEAQEEGAIYMFQYGSLLYKSMDDAGFEAIQNDPNYQKASVDGMAAKFTQAFEYYGGTDGQRTMMLALEEEAGGQAHGLIQKYEMKSGRDLINYYKDLIIRENPVNAPVYKFDRKIEAVGENGQKIRCHTCLSNTEGPFFIGDKLSDEEKAMVLATAQGSGFRLDNNYFRDNKDKPLEDRVKLIEESGRTTNGAAYLYYYKAAYDRWGFPENKYLNKMVNLVNEVRANLPEESRLYMEEMENAKGDIDSLVARFTGSSDATREQRLEVIKKCIEANDKLNEALYKMRVEQGYEREWGGKVIKMNPNKNPDPDGQDYNLNSPDVA